ncbi:NAD-dependent epimerase/dehydratase family protein [Exiguobacterium sp. SH3S1]|uniref:NAD-dependent epimerase/dehydratase family protein n=1 Tax=Exiguobacterium sp. SH3S1 TaxID=2510955 RepID=UPI00103FB866|nr:NAD-dependent epimerase/dehydratase family protein [Exiguobacterium sp. SH3S1]TCI64068.1 NAD-dependent epimerase/dehydratase family protein [Exiguobacterium sp. SH3S1]
MNILITGGYGFIGSTLAERFFKEGHHIHILDNLSTGTKANIDFKHRYLIANTSDSKCETFFKTYSFDVVIHCATSNQHSHPIHPVQSNVNGLLNILTLSKKYQVKQFIYCSTSEVYGNQSEIPVIEAAIPAPNSPFALDQLHGEAYCQQWSELYGLSTLVFRIACVYGPKQHTSQDSTLITSLTTSISNGTNVNVNGSPEWAHDFIFSGDVADAMYRGVMSQLTGIYNLSSNTQTSLYHLCELVGLSEVTYSHPPKAHTLQLENRKLKTDLDWVPKYTIEEGINTTLSYYEKHDVIPPVTIDKKSTVFGTLFSHPFIQIAENLTLFLIFFMFSFIMTPVVDTPDYWFIYILLAALLFGKTQSLVASILAVGVQFYDHAATGRNILSLFVDNSILAVFTIYLLVGLIVSYVMERRKIEIQFLKDELAATSERHHFLNEIYEETLDIKNQLHQQIIHSEDSIGSVYEATRALDSLEPEGLFVGSISVLEKTLKAEHFAIYLVNQSAFARLAAKSADPAFSPKNSLDLEEHSLVNEVMQSKEIVFNKALSPEDAMFGAPLLRQGEIFAVVLCYQVPFQNLTLSYRNLIDVMTRLINSSLDRSFGYIDAVQLDRYVRNTNALKQDYFERIVIQKEQGKIELNIPYTLLHIRNSITDNVIHSVDSTLRTTDYLGYRDDNELYALLSNATADESQIVIERLAQKSIHADVVEDVSYVE